MFSLVRSGPKILLLESNNIENLKKYLIYINACNYDLSSAFEKAGEDYTIIAITEKMKDIVNISDMAEVLIIKEDPASLLSSIINDKSYSLISRSRLAPRIIIMRTMGDMEKVLEEVRKDHEGTIGSFFQMLDTHNNSGTLLVLTEKPLHKKLCFNDVYEKSLFIEQDYYTLIRSLRMNALKYLNQGLGNRDWYELEIRIYDRYSAYNIHYERLLKIIELLELGIILGESWSKDYPRFLMEVGVYRVRFFTFHEPQYIKKLLVGLEHLDDGLRIVDYDLYYNRKKIDWTDAAKGEFKARHLMSKKYRDEILSKLSDSEKQEIIEFENEILKTRY